MRVTVNNQCFDDDDKRCTCRVSTTCNAITGNHCYIVWLSCYDTDTGAINWYQGILPHHLYDYEMQQREFVIEHILQSGGNTWRVLEQLESAKEYFEEITQ